MKRAKQFTKKCLSLLLVLLLSTAYLSTAVGNSYALAHPQAVNEGKSDDEITADDLEQFSNRRGYDFHEAKEEDYIPGELIVDIITSGATAASALNSVEEEFDVQPQRVLSTEKLVSEKGTSASSLGNAGQTVTSYLMETDEEDIIGLCDRLKERDDVFHAQPNFIYYACAEEQPEDVNLAEESEPDTPDYTPPEAFETSTYKSNLQWWFDYCNIADAWSGTNYGTHSQDYGMGKGIKVAVIDTGCNTAHEDIVDNLYLDNQNNCGYTAYTSTYIKKNDATNDTDGHGSHCCGTIAMSGKNTVGGIGTAPECQLIVLKADRDTGKASFAGSEIKTCLLKAKEFGADIISMSLGGYNFDYELYRTYQQVSSSCLIVCAAGNDSFDTTEKLHFPSAASCVMGVMALGNSYNKDSLATFSNYDTTGNFYKVVAPGTAIYSLDYTGNDKYCFKQGTSMATPAAAGMIACYMSYIRNVKGLSWTPAQFQYKIESIITSSSYNTLTCTGKQANQPIAYAKGSAFSVMNLKALFDKYSAFSFSTTAVSFSNSTIRDGVVNATGLAAAKIDSCAAKRVSLLYWDDSTRKTISDYSDLSKLPGLNYLDLSGSTGVTSSNIATVIGACPATIVHLNLNTSTKLGDLYCLQTAKFPCLHYLDISSNNISTLAPIQKFTSLKTLIASSNSISNISPIAGMTHLEKIDLKSNSIQDPNPAFASKFASYIDLSYNKLTDYQQLYNYKGAYVDESFKATAITFKVNNNNMTGLNNTTAAALKQEFEKNNTVDGKLVATVTLEWGSQSAASSTAVPMTSFYISSSKTISREALCAGNLNQKAVTGFTAYPTTANQYNYLKWSCSEEGYFGSDGTVLVSPSQITSCRTLTLSASAPSATGITTVKTLTLTITAPEIYNAYLTDRVVAKGTKVSFLVCTNMYTEKICLKTSLGSANEYWYKMPSSSDDGFTAYASDKCKVALFNLPEELYKTAGSNSIYIFAADSERNYTNNSTSDVSGRSSCPYKSLGTLYVKDSVTTSTNITITNDQLVNRCGQAALYATNCGTGSSSPAKAASTYTLSSMSLWSYIGESGYYGNYGCGHFGKAATGYPNASAYSGTFSITVDGVSTPFKGNITTVLPAVKYVEMRNPTTYKTDQYAEYIVKTNTAATQVKAYHLEKGTSVTKISNNIATAFSSSSGTYANYNATYNNKVWAVRVSLDDKNELQPITFVAGDQKGESRVETKTPAIKMQFSGSYYFYPGESSTKDMSNFVSFQPAEADCCNTPTYSITKNDYLSLSTSRVTASMQKFLTNFEGTTTANTYATVKAKLPFTTASSASVYISRPVVSMVTYDSVKSALIPGGTVYFTAKTFGSDTIYIRDTSDKTVIPVLTLTKDNPDCYEEQTDAKGNVTTIWNFTRQFDEQTTQTMYSYVRSSYQYSSSLTANSASHSSTSATSKAPGDYSAWEAQLARMDEALLTKLQSDYTDSALYNERFAEVQNTIDTAVLTYNTSQQYKINNQTASLKDSIDALFGYSDYDEAMDSCNALLEYDSDFSYETLRALAVAVVDDSNCMETVNALHVEIARLEALIEKAEQAQELLTTIETAIPSILTQEMPHAYGEESYTALKQLHDTLCQKLENGTYENAQLLEEDYLALLQVYTQLHTHTFTQQVVEPTTKAEGYTEYRCSVCDYAYHDNFVPRIPLYYSVDSLSESPCILVFRSADTRFETAAKNGNFEINDLLEGTYTVYAKPANCLSVVLENYQMTDSDYTCDKQPEFTKGDFSGDDSIDIGDISVLLAGDNYAHENADLNMTGDIQITVEDISILLSDALYSRTGELSE